MLSRTQTAAACALAVLGFAAAPAAAQDAVANFYKGKTITVVVGVSPGGGIDTFARLLARRIVERIPGHPQMVITNMPGAGTKVAAKYLYTVAAKDGTVLGTVLPGALLEPTRIPVAKRDYDPVNFNYLGNGNIEALSTVVRTDSPAFRAGVRPDDLIVFVGDNLVHSCQGFRDELAHIERGGTLRLVLMRGQELVEVELNSSTPEAAQP